ncbi:CdaR family protein [Polaribacter tangerinus]|uniref:CdaR family protein n=1 Tax=Polaribacter tangerinus TaxID=1920034 RepID=UPI000B4B4BC5|nr:YbbR-like domain-containing protein [Polaribacter tangerinus]
MKTKQKISKTFLVFLLASTLIWLLITLSKQYTITTNLPIIYKGIPKSKIVQEIPEKELEVNLSGTGFKIARLKIFYKEVVIDAKNVKRKHKNDYYILAKNQLNSIQKQLPKDIVLKSIGKDSLFLNLGNLVSKKVPIVSSLNLNFKIGYDLVAPISIKPDSITIYGPESYVSKLESLPILPLKIENISSDFSKKTTLKYSKEIKNLKFSEKVVTVSGKVKQFTEGKLQIPYKIINKPKDIQISTLSNKVTVMYVVALSDFNKINETSFLVDCDFEFAQSNNLNYLIPKLKNISPLIKSYKIIPNKIDFLIQK